MRSFSFIDFVSLLSALRWTVVLVVLALGFGAPLGLGLATGRISRLAPLRWISAAAIQVIQGVPLLGLLFFFYFGMPVFLGIQVPALVAVTVAYTLYTAAFLGEIWRGGLEAVKQAQWEAGACLGLSRWQQFRHIVGPQALRLSLPPTVGFLVQLVKGTSLASIIGFVELARAGQVVSAATFQPLLTYAVVAAIYFATCLPLTLWSRSLEARLDGSR
ncbi:MULTISPECIES: amino acid ABC transporter permease [unclassified Bradyrhizobium]|uniref:amino acid ABC transporter permease n=1 Tax=unclassified Bradyrhizobium TaxID=2631580 RepID=UPI001BA81E34|nr:MULTISPECIES: amino acid ABC transporter permease [unclassified Bradyrhizobium]MBR1224429.1 amino acid ABC transporter permease [Bradyrhizobium sp. AUGA SZCCT0176]MBR1231054.1 amino acid ABC transporter permease [Bradyrhizobium sp. AUGA SZCCT0182]MBR1283216.1 amino acid ABC transporter permease [Bradyrhizobium sp. AUGA SZCCT0177]MBR1297932.1 amino acid ABC transporter permease [Bradyrhizobium sp. AUGA SZCCT0042]